MIIIENIGVWAQETNVRMVKELLLVRQQDIEVMADGADFSDYEMPYGSITLAVDAVLKRFDFAQDTCQMSESREQSPNGAFFNVNITFDVPKNRTDILKWLHTNRFARFVVLLRDGNGESYIAGDRQTALQLSASRAVGAKNIYQFSLSGALRKPVYHFEGLDEVKLTDGPEFGTDFGMDFNV